MSATINMEHRAAIVKSFYRIHVLRFFFLLSRETFQGMWDVCYGVAGVCFRSSDHGSYGDPVLRSRYDLRGFCQAVLQLLVGFSRLVVLVAVTPCRVLPHVYTCYLGCGLKVSRFDLESKRPPLRPSLQLFRALCQVPGLFVRACTR